MRHVFWKAALLVAVSLSTGTARADFVKGTTGLSTFAQQLLFPVGAQPDQTIITNQFAAQGVSFSTSPVGSSSGSNGGLVFTTADPSPIPNLSPAYLTNYAGSNSVPPPYTINIFFTEDQTAVSFVMATFELNGGSISMSALNNGVNVSTSFMPAPSSILDPANVYTVTTGGGVATAFDQIQIVLNQSLADVSAGFDDFRLGTFTPPAGVPEPSSFVLGGLATLVVGGLTWRRRRQAKVIA